MVAERVYHKMKVTTIGQVDAVCYVCNTKADCYDYEHYYCANHMLMKQQGKLKYDKNIKANKTSTTYGETS